MYQYVDYMQCKYCGNTNILFKMRLDTYHKKKFGIIRYKVTQTCKLCYLENCLIDNEKYWIKNRDKILKKQSKLRRGNPKYLAMAKKYRENNKEKISEYKKRKYIPVLFDGRKRKRIRNPIPMDHPIRKFMFGGIK